MVMLPARSGAAFGVAVSAELGRVEIALNNARHRVEGSKTQWNG